MRRMKKRKICVFLPCILAAAMVTGNISPAAAYALSLPLEEDIVSITEHDDTGIGKLIDLIRKDLEDGIVGEDATSDTPATEVPSEESETQEASSDEADPQEEPSEEESAKEEPGQEDPTQE